MLKRVRVQLKPIVFQKILYPHYYFTTQLNVQFSKMKYSIPYSCIVLIHAVIVAAYDPIRLTAVTSDEIAEALHRRVRREGKPPHLLFPNSGQDNNNYLYPSRTLTVRIVDPPSPMDTDVKNQICHYITGSDYFEVLHEKGVYTHEIYIRLRNQDPSVIVNGEFNERPPVDEMVHTNPVIPINNHITEDDPKTVFEYAFTCLTIDERYDEDTVFTYLVSAEYNLSDTPNPYIPGRFIMVCPDRLDNVITTTAIAEAPAKVLSTPGAIVERLYMEKREGHQPG